MAEDDAGDALAKLVVGLVLIGLAIYAAVLLLAVLLTAGLISVPGGVCAMVSHYGVRSKRLSEIRSASVLSQVVNPMFDGVRLSWAIDDGAFIRLLRLRSAATLSAMTACIATVLTIVLAFGSGFEPSVRAITSDTSYDRVFGIVAAGLAVVTTPILAWFASYRGLQRSVVSHSDATLFKASRARRTLARMCSTPAVQTNAFAF